MPRYLAELYVPSGQAGDLAAATARARAAAKELADVRCLRSIFVPEDETWFLLYEAGSATDVRRAVARASLPVARVVEAVAPQ
jgi:hypothetical protein